MKRVAQRPTSVTIALIYTRVSSDQQAETGVSLPMQLQEARRYAAHADMVLGNEFNDILSGKRDDRPGYAALLDEVRRLTSEGRRVAIIVWRLDRLGRRLLERVQRRQEMAALGCEVHSVTEGLVSDVVANVMAALAEEEVRQLGQRVAGARRHIKASGYRPIGDLPYGYRSRDASPDERAAGSPRRVLDVDDDQAQIVLDLFERASGGTSLNALSRWLRSLPAEQRGGRSWPATAVRHLLTNPVYVARHADPDGGDVLAGPVQKWPAIIDDATFRAVADEIALNQRLPRRPSVASWLSGFARCPRPACGGHMTGERRGASARSPRYRCEGRHEGYRCTATVVAASLDASVLQQITALLDTAAAISGPLKRALRLEWDARRGTEADPDLRRLGRQRADLTASVERSKKRLSDAALLLLDGGLDRAGYDLVRQRVEQEMRDAQDTLDRLERTSPRPALPDLDTALSLIGGWRTALADGDVETRRRVLVEIIQRVEPVKLGWGSYAARITWTDLGTALRSIVEAVSTAA